MLKGTLHARIKAGKDAKKRRLQQHFKKLKMFQMRRKTIAVKSPQPTDSPVSLSPLSLWSKIKIFIKRTYVKLLEYTTRR